MIQPYLLAVPAAVSVIALLQSSEVFTFTLLCCGTHWLGAMVYLDGDEKNGAGCNGASILLGIFGLLYLNSKYTGLFLLLIAASYVCCLVYVGIEADNRAGTEAQQAGTKSRRKRRDTELWEVKKIRRVKRK